VSRSQEGDRWLGRSCDCAGCRVARAPARRTIGPRANTDAEHTADEVLALRGSAGSVGPRPRVDGQEYDYKQQQDHGHWYIGHAERPQSKLPVQSRECAGDAQGGRRHNAVAAGVTMWARPRGERLIFFDERALAAIRDYLPERADTRCPSSCITTAGVLAQGQTVSAGAWRLSRCG
jgi:hypothetical protein